MISWSGEQVLKTVLVWFSVSSIIRPLETTREKKRVILFLPAQITIIINLITNKIINYNSSDISIEPQPVLQGECGDDE